LRPSEGDGAVLGITQIEARTAENQSAHQRRAKMLRRCPSSVPGEPMREKPAADKGKTSCQCQDGAPQ